MPVGPGGMPLPYGPPGMPQGGGMPGMAGMMGGAGAPGGMPGNPFATGQPPKEPIQTAGETAITQLLEMATSNPMLLIGLSMAGAAREISQLTGLSRRRGGGTAGQGKGGAMPSAATMLGGSMGDMDRLVALQSMMGGGAPPMGGPAGPGGPPMPPMGGAPGGPPGMPPGMPGMPPQFAGLV